MDDVKLKRLLRSATAEQLALFVLALTCLLWLSFPLWEKAPQAPLSPLSWVGLSLALAAGLALPALLRVGLLRQGLREEPDAAPGLRLGRLLGLPRRLEVLGLGADLVPAACVAFVLAQGFGARPTTFAAGLGTLVALLAFLSLGHAVQALRTEQRLLPAALAEFHRHPTALPPAPQAFWSTQLRWYLPYLLASLLVAALAGAALVAMAPPARAPSSTALPVLGLYLAGLVTLLGQGLTRRLVAAVDRLREAVVALGSGDPGLPLWIGGDELGALALAAAFASDSLQHFSIELRDAVHTLGTSAHQLRGATEEQNEGLQNQAASLARTRATTEEIRRASRVASDRAAAVLEQSERSEALGLAGGQTLERTLAVLGEVRHQVAQMAAGVLELELHRHQIATITVSVKDLADRSRLLALNAAIEAQRAGAQGHGFAVVAREIRTLADTSLSSTQQVNEILQQLGHALGQTSALTKAGALRVEAGFEEIRNTDQTLRELSSISGQNAASVRDIASALGAQSKGVNQIFEALEDLASLMTLGLARVKASDEATLLLEQVGDKVDHFLGSYRWDGSGQSAGTGGAGFALAVARDLGDHHSRLEALVEAAADGIYGIDLTGACTFINPAGARILGYDEAELLGRNMHAIIHSKRADGSPLPVAECRIYQAFRTGIVSRVDDDVLWRKDGALVPVDYTSSPIFRQGRIEGAVVTFARRGADDD